MEEEKEIKDERAKLPPISRVETNQHGYDDCCHSIWKHKTIVWPIIGFVIIAIGFFCLGRVSNRLNFLHGERQRVVINDFDRGPGMMKGRGFERMDVRGDGEARGGFRHGRNTMTVSAIDNNVITAKDSDNTEYKINVTSDTSFIKAGAIAKQSDLKNGDKILVSGPSNSNGEINARVIRIN